MPKLITTENVPTWAIAYLEYGDADSISQEEQEEIDAWLKIHFPDGYVCEYLWDDKDDFTIYPLFGKPCETVPTHFYKP